MNRRSVTFVAAGLFAAIGGAAAIALSTFDVSARTRHWPATTWAIEVVRDHSIRSAAAGIVVPAGLGDRVNIMAGAEHYRAHCAVCHGAPGVEPDIIARGMYPAPPDLRYAAEHRGPAELFWIVKNGIKMSGMPAWGDHGDEELWPVVALMQQLPKMTAEDYTRLTAEIDQAAGHHQHDTGAIPTPAAMPVAEAASPTHKHDGHSHSHSHH